VKQRLSHIRAKYDTQSSKDHTNTSNNICYQCSTDCDASEAYTAKMWHRDSHHRDAVTTATLHRSIADPVGQFEAISSPNGCSAHLSGAPFKPMRPFLMTIEVETDVKNTLTYNMFYTSLNFTIYVPDFHPVSIVE